MRELRHACPDPVRATPGEPRRVLEGKGLASTSPLFLVLVLAVAGWSQTREPDDFFRRYIGLNREQIVQIDRGHAVVKLLPSKVPAEVTVFGAVYIKASPEGYLQAARNLDQLRRSGYLAVHEFRQPPQLSDLDGFTLEDDDIRALRGCRPGNCALQLPLESIEALRSSVDWSRPEVASQLNRGAQRMALEFLTGYQKMGNGALGIYYDKDQPIRVLDQFEGLLQQSDGLARYLPEIDRFLRDYPQASLPHADEFFYWEKVRFGLKPTLRINHAAVYRPPDANERGGVVVVKQLYASHYFQSALDISVCVRDTAGWGRNGFYLITVKSSRQAGLTGVKGTLVRKVAVSRTLSSLERSLNGLKIGLELQK